MLLTKLVKHTSKFVLLLLPLGMLGSASAATSPVFLYDADLSTSTGSTPSVLNAGIQDENIIDQSSAGNNAKVGNGVGSFSSFAGTIETVEDDPFDVAGQLSFQFSGSNGRINTDATDLLTDTLIASNGGYTYETWIKVPALPPAGDLATLISFAGTDQLVITEAGQLQSVAHRGGDRRNIGPAGLITDGEWNHVIVRFDTSKDTDGSTGSGDGAGQNNLLGNVSAVINDVHYDVGTVGTGTFGDTLDRSMSVGGHPQGFGTTDFTGSLYNPSASLGVDEAFANIRLYVNRTTGEGQLVHFGEPVAVDSYKIESAGATDVGEANSLDPAAWDSLQDQNFDGSGSSLGDFDNDGNTDGADYLAWQRGEVSDPPEGSDLTDWTTGYGGSGGASPWSEFGTPSDTVLEETSTAGSTFSDDQSLSMQGDVVSLANSVSLGNIFVVGEDEDLSFSYGVEGETNDRVGLVVFFTPAAALSAATAVPEPATALMLLIGLTAAGGMRVRRRV